jgi:hypothetical protein
MPLQIITLIFLSNPMLGKSLKMPKFLKGKLEFQQ